MKIFTLTLLCSLFAIASFAQLSIKNADWQEISNPSSVEKTTQLNQPLDFKLFQLQDYNALFNRLLSAPERFNQNEGDPLIMGLPLADGSIEKFKVLYTPVMEAP
ncbi:MAG: hypothetical protein HKN09_00855, partial [Saprospiraceae bacterium]|nr:hypothetical protein [Saprospiraceae bacterium]